MLAVGPLLMCELLVQYVTDISVGDYITNGRCMFSDTDGTAHTGTHFKTWDNQHFSTTSLYCIINLMWLSREIFFFLHVCILQYLVTQQPTTIISIKVKHSIHSVPFSPRARKSNSWIGWYIQVSNHYVFGRSCFQFSHTKLHPDIHFQMNTLQVAVGFQRQHYFLSADKLKMCRWPH